VERADRGGRTDHPRVALPLLSEPITEYLLELQEQNPDSFIHVVLGHLAMDTFWEQALHQNTALSSTCR
jgi:hypothetical protein